MKANLKNCKPDKRGPRPWWYCGVCGAQNHESDGECQYCVCEGPACMRANCSGPCVNDDEPRKD